MHTEHRPQGRCSGSSRACWRNCIRQPLPCAYARIRSASAARTWRSAVHLASSKYHGCPVATQPPDRRSTVPSTARIFSSVSSRPRRIPVAASTATSDCGLVAAERVEDPLDLRLVGDARGGEVVPDPLVRLGRHQHGERVVQRPTGPAHLLVVGHRRRRRPEVDAERQVGLVVAHPERRGRHQRLDLVVPQPVLELLAVRGLPRVRGHVVALLGQEGGDPLGLGHRQHVDDAGARQLPQRVGDPGVAVEHAEPGHHGQPERGPGQRAAQRHGVLAELGGDVGGHPLVGRGGGGQHRRAGREGEQGPGQPLVVRPEVEAPVGDAVRLVDHQQSGGRQQVGQLAGERRVGQPLGRDQQHVDPARPHVAQHLVPVVDVGGVDRGGPQPGPARRGDLVPHQRQQRRDHQGRSRLPASRSAAVAAQ